MEQIPQQNSKSSSFNKYEGYLYLLFAFHAISYFLFRFLDKSYQTWDSAGHLSLSMRMGELLTEYLNNSQVTLVDFLKLSDYYPPFVHISTSFLNVIFGYNSSLLLFLIFATFIWSIYMVYKTVQLLGFSDETAFMTAAFYSLFPQVADQARLFHLEIPLILSLLYAYKYLLNSDGFRNRKNTLLFFLVFAVSQLIKWYSFLFLAVPVIYVLYKSYTQGIEKSKIINLVIGSVLFLVLATPWYIVNFEDLVNYASIFSVGEADDPELLLSFENITFYLRNTISFQIFLVPFIFTVLGAVLLFKNKLKSGYLMLVHIGFIFFVFTFIGNKNLRYLLPLTPIYALFMAYFIFNVDSYRKLYRTVAVIFVVTGFVFSSFNQVQSSSPTAKVAGVLFAGPLYNNVYTSTTAYSYDTREVPIEELLEFIVVDAKREGIKPIGVTPLMDSEEFSVASLELVRLENRHANVYLPVPYLQFSGFKSNEEMQNFFNEFNVSYVIVPDDPGPSGLRNYTALIQMSAFLNSEANLMFEPIKEFKSTDNRYVVFRRLPANLSIPVNECQTLTNYGGRVDFVVEPGNTYLFFTGHFSTKFVSRDFEFGTLRMFAVENEDTKVRSFGVENLPLAGISVCHRLGTDLYFEDEARSAFANPNSCGDRPCSKIVITRINTDGEYEEVVVTP